MMPVVSTSSVGPARKGSARRDSTVVRYGLGGYGDRATAVRPMAGRVTTVTAGRGVGNPSADHQPCLGIRESWFVNRQP